MLLHELVTFLIKLLISTNKIMICTKCVFAHVFFKALHYTQINVHLT